MTKHIWVICYVMKFDINQAKSSHYTSQTKSERMTFGLLSKHQAVISL